MSAAIMAVLFFVLQMKPRRSAVTSSPNNSTAENGERGRWIDRLQKKTIFVDVETTGLSDSDRVVSLGFIVLDKEKISDTGMTVSKGYYIFNPGIPSSPGALRVHGLGDDVLALQQSFSTVAVEIRETMQNADLVVAHNVAFDLKFINRELRLAGMEELNGALFCTMEEYRKRGNYGRSSLDTIAKDIGLLRLNVHHNALANSWLAMQVFFYLHGSPHYRTNMPFDLVGRPSNYVAPPAMPAKKRAPRKRKRPSSEKMVSGEQ